MREMKDSGIEWIGKIPKDWNIRKLFGLLDSIGSGTTPRGEEYYSEDGVPWLNTGDLNDGYIKETTKYVSEIALRECSALQVHKSGSVVIAMYGATIGKLGITEIELTTNQACCVMNPTDDLIEKYLFYILSAAKEYFIYSSYGAGQPNISQNTIRNLKVPFMPLIEQHKIIDYLDTKCSQIDTIIEKQQAIIENLKEYKLSLITECVTKGLNPDVVMKESGIDWIGKMPAHWQKARLSDVTDRIIVGLATSVTPYYRPSGMVLLRNLNIKEGYLDDSDLLYLDKKFADSQNGKYIEKDDVLTVHTGSNLGLTCVVPDKYEHTLSFTTLITTPNKDILDSYYLMYTINSGLGKAEIDKLKCGDIKPNLNVGQFKYFTVFMPLIEEQREIVAYLNEKCDDIENDILIKESIITKLQEYKKSLIYEVVTGKKEV